MLTEQFRPSRIAGERRTRPCWRTGVVASLMLMLAAPAAHAQQSRAQELEQRQAEKAKHLTPPKPAPAERIMDALARQISFVPPIGFYVYRGKIISGGSFSLGPAFRAPIGDTGAFDARGAISIRNYKLLATGLTFPSFADKRVQVRASASWIDAPKVAFYGIGNVTTFRPLTRFEYQPLTVGATLTARPARWFTFVGGTDYLSIKSKDASRARIQDSFDPATIPGFDADPDYVVGRISAAIDTRHAPGYTNRGGLYRGELARYSQRNTGSFSFDQAEVEINQFIPLVRANWVIALRGLLTTTSVKGDNDVPFFLMPALGGGSRLRGFGNYRFRDRHRLLMSAEYRWAAAHYVDMALFWESGKVAARRADLDLHDLRDAYGIGLRFHSPSMTVLRFEVARSREGTRLIIGSGPVF